MIKPQRPGQGVGVVKHHTLSPRMKRMVDRYRKETAAAAEEATRARVAASLKSKFSGLNRNELQQAEIMQDKILVLLGSLARHAKRLKRRPVIGSPRECAREFRHLLRASKLSLVHKYKNEGLLCLEQGLNLKAINALHHAIRLKKQSSTKFCTKSNTAKSCAPEADDDYGWIESNHLESLTTLSMDLMGVPNTWQQRTSQQLRESHVPCVKNSMPHRVSQLYCLDTGGGRVSGTKEQSAFDNSSRLGPSFFTPLSPRGHKWTLYRDPRRDARFSHLNKG